jgi:hypothetical protein
LYFFKFLSSSKKWQSVAKSKLCFLQPLSKKLPGFSGSTTSTTFFGEGLTINFLVLILILGFSSGNLISTF